MQQFKRRLARRFVQLFILELPGPESTQEHESSGALKNHYAILII
jgi:hypothetical protein